MGYIEMWGKDISFMTIYNFRVLIVDHILRTVSAGIELNAA